LPREKNLAKKKLCFAKREKISKKKDIGFANRQNFS
jgi:hypothetical protein